MTALLHRTLLVSTTALAALTFIPVAGFFAPATLSTYITSDAQARGGDDDGGDDDSGSSSDDSSSDDSGSDDSGRDSSDDSSDDSSGRDRDRDRSSDDDDDDSYDDSDGRDDDRAEDDSSRSGNRDRDEIRLIVNNTQLQGLISGALMPVDQNGKRLRYEVEQEDGGTEIKLRAPRGTLSSVTVVPVP